MHVPRLFSVMRLLCLFCLSGALLPPACHAADDAAATELQATIDAYVKAYGEGSVEQVMAYWTEDADFVDIRGRFHRGRDEVAALFRRGFADQPGRTMVLNRDERKFLSPDIAMDDGILELKSADGEVARGRYSVVWVKRDNAWRIRSARDIPLESADEAQASPTPEPPALEQLAWLVGTWKAQSEKHEIALKTDWALERAYLVQSFDITSGDEKFTVLTYITFDPSQQSYRSWYFDSRGGFGGGLWSEHNNTWLIDVAAVLPDGMIGSSVMIWQRVDNDTINWKALGREVEGAAIPDAEQTYHRVKK